ncbi:ThiF protein, putative [Shewanella piezotolerans WP3]|uniref:ThiF protein, putative n=1 Tax=Shewanella piezotolerans (strain WP3 / JCM 13877) TaxID=225849 RepID=B8CNV8_SHEPW|nr:HesA/MoeB/ThiF family protein [Shewanella piezotolerans]ACJ29077.1 ThiF protein, putative [Shewanella piezotolerans WP3]
MAVTDKEFLHYSRQILLPEVGEQGQNRFKQSHILIIGVGGLGTLTAQYLAAAGIGKITLVDGDVVELSNLPRQLLFSKEDLGANKAQVAAIKLMRAYEGSEIYCYQNYLNAANTQELFCSQISKFDLLLDCSDNFEVRQLVNQQAIEQGITLVSASAAHFQGQLLSINQQISPESGCYHCLYPSDMSVSQTCQTIGVLGPMVGTLASMQALMSLNLLLDVDVLKPSLDETTAKTKINGNQLLGKLFRFDGGKFTWRQASLLRDPNCSVCSA